MGRDHTLHCDTDTHGLILWKRLLSALCDATCFEGVTRVIAFSGPPSPEYQVDEMRRGSIRAPEALPYDEIAHWAAAHLTERRSLELRVRVMRWAWHGPYLPAEQEPAAASLLVIPAGGFPQAPALDAPVMYRAGDLSDFRSDLRGDAAERNVLQLQAELLALAPAGLTTVRAPHPDHAADPARCTWVAHADPAGWRADLVRVLGPVGAALPVTDRLVLEVAEVVDGVVAGHWPVGGAWVGTTSVHQDLGPFYRALAQLA